MSIGALGEDRYYERNLLHGVLMLLLFSSTSSISIDFAVRGSVSSKSRRIPPRNFSFLDEEETFLLVPFRFGPHGLKS